MLRRNEQGATKRDKETAMGRIGGIRERHPLATGFVCGTLAGVGVGMLVAPRRGSETRKRMGDGVNSMVGHTSDRYRRAKEAVDDWARRGHGVYVNTRERVVKGAHGTSRYVRDVADAVTMKSRRHAEGLRRMEAGGSSSVSEHPRKAV
jgi:gas vesicle protein